MSEIVMESTLDHNVQTYIHKIFIFDIFRQTALIIFPNT